MQIFDVFNGDADGLCALVQLRLADPIDSILITGVKRDISLVQQVPMEQAAQVNVLDLSLDKNRLAVDTLLAAGSQIFYVDHHYPGKVLRAHPNFQALIDTSTMVCTSLLIDSYVHRRFHNWAIVAAFGDNLNIVAKDLACKAGLFDQKTQALKELGVCINYNSYGASVDDLHFHPAYLFRELVQYKDPLDFISANVPIYNKLRSGYQEDLARGLAADKVSDTPSSLVIGLPDEPWARRVSGVLGNELTNTNPDRACAVVTACPNATFLVSIRAPLNNRTGADEVARQFPSGGGRKGAAGINALPVHQLDEFIQLMSKYWSK